MRRTIVMNNEDNWQMGLLNFGRFVSSQSQTLDSVMNVSSRVPGNVARE